MGKPITEELGTFVIAAVAELDKAIAQPPRPGISISLPDLTGITLAASNASNNIPDVAVVQERGL